MCCSFLHVLNKDKTEEPLSHVRHLNRDYMLVTPEAYDFLKSNVIPKNPDEPHLFGIFYWDGRRIHEIEAKPLNIVSLAYNKSQNLTLRRIRLIYFEDSFCFPFEAKIGPAGSALCFLLQQYYLTNKQVKKVEKEKKPDKRGGMIRKMIDEEVEVFFLNRKYSVSSLETVLREKRVVLGRLLDFGEGTDELEGMMEELADEDVLLVQPADVEFSASSRTRKEFGLKRKDVNTECSSCGKFVDWWVGDVDAVSALKTQKKAKKEKSKSKPKLQKSGSLLDHLRTDSGIIANIQLSEWDSGPEMEAPEAVLQCDCGMTHYCSLECKYYHKFRHNALFNCQPKNFYFDALFRVWQIAKHPQNQFANIYNTTEQYFIQYFRSLNERGPGSKQKRKKSGGKGGKSDSSKPKNKESKLEKKGVLQILKEATEGKSPCLEKDDVRSLIGESIKISNRFDTKTGLANIGNTCYMNAILQMIFTAGERLFTQFFQDPQALFQTLHEHRDSPLSLSVLLVVYELLFTGFDFLKNEELQRHLKCYLSPKVISFLENMLSSSSKRARNSKNINSSGNDTDSEDERQRLGSGSSTRKRKLPSLSERRRLTPNFVNPVMIKFFIGIKRDEFKEFRQADGHELFVTFLDLLDNEKTEISRLLEREFTLRLRNKFTCTTCGFKKFKPESLNHISISFENAVRTELENDFDVFLGDAKCLFGYSKGRVRSEYSSFGVAGFKEYLVHALNPTKEKKEGEHKDEKDPSETNEICSIPGLKVTQITEISPPKLSNSSQNPAPRSASSNFGQYIMVFADTTCVSFPQFNVIQKKFDQHLRLNIDQFIKTKMNISYINDQCPRDSVSLIYPINPRKPFFASLSFKSIERFQISSMTQKISLFRARLLSLDEPQISVSDLMFKIFLFFEPLLLNHFYKKNSIPVEQRLKSLTCLFPPDRPEDLVQVLFFKKFDSEAMFSSLESSFTTGSVSEPSLEYVNNIQNLTLPGSKAKSKPSPEPLTKAPKVPAYFEKLLSLLRKCFAKENFTVTLVAQDRNHQSQAYFLTSINHIRQQLMESGKSDLDSKAIETPNVSSKIVEEDEEKIFISATPKKSIVISSEEIILRDQLDAREAMPNLELMINAKNPLKSILSALRSKERQSDKDMNSEVDQNLISLADCVKGFFEPSRLELNCSKCPNGKHFETQYQLSDTSPYLIVHLKRFMPRMTQNGYEFVKNEERIVVDQNLTIGTASFKLEGIVNHFGKIDSGHYSYDRLMPASNSGSSQIRVLEYDDHKLKVHRYQKSRLESKDAYVVLYKCVERVEGGEGQGVGMETGTEGQGDKQLTQNA